MENEINELANSLEEEIDPNVMSEEELQGIVGKEIEDAIDYADNTVSPIRASATEYYRGDPFGNEEDGRSQVVSMDVRDTVQAILPSLMRVFHSTENTVEYSPTSEEDVANAKQATEFANFIINRDNNGFLEMHAAFKDALIRKVGVLKCYWDDQTRYETIDFTGLDDNALSALMEDQDSEVEIVSSEAMVDPEMDPRT